MAGPEKLLNLSSLSFHLYKKEIKIRILLGLLWQINEMAHYMTSKTLGHDYSEAFWVGMILSGNA